MHRKNCCQLFLSFTHPGNCNCLATASAAVTGPGGTGCGQGVCPPGARSRVCPWGPQFTLEAGERAGGQRGRGPEQRSREPRATPVSSLGVGGHEGLGPGSMGLAHMTSRYSAMLTLLCLQEPASRDGVRNDSRARSRSHEATQLPSAPWQSPHTESVTACAPVSAGHGPHPAPV